MYYSSPWVKHCCVTFGPAALCRVQRPVNNQETKTSGRHWKNAEAKPKATVRSAQRVDLPTYTFQIRQHRLVTDGVDSTETAFLGKTRRGGASITRGHLLYS